MIGAVTVNSSGTLHGYATVVSSNGGSNFSAVSELLPVGNPLHQGASGQFLAGVAISESGGPGYWVTYHTYTTRRVINDTNLLEIRAIYIPPKTQAAYPAACPIGKIVKTGVDPRSWYRIGRCVDPDSPFPFACYGAGDFVSIASGDSPNPIITFPFVDKGGLFNTLFQFFAEEPPAARSNSDFRPRTAPFREGSNLRSLGRSHNQVGISAGQRIAANALMRAARR